MSSSISKELDVESTLALIQPGGRLSHALKSFEAREQQQAMMRNIIDAYNKDEISLIEAGTGTGKSLAYLIPAILWAAKTGQRTVISTNTINLQEQLMEKDIPMLIKALGIDVKAVLVKGMGNYLCQRKFDDIAWMIPSFPPEEAKDLIRIEAWKAQTTDGTLSSLPFLPQQGTWEKVGAEGDACNGPRCPFHSSCFFFKARKVASDAQILIVNHHLLFADLAKRAADNNYDNTAVLPIYNRIIIDEAHNIEDIATDYFASKVSRTEMSRLMARLASEKQGKLTALKAKISSQRFSGKNAVPGLSKVHIALEIDLPAQRRELVQLLGDLFDALHTFLSDSRGASISDEDGSGMGEQKTRMLPDQYKNVLWNENVLPLALQATQVTKKYIASIAGVVQEVGSINHDPLKEATQGILVDLAALTNRLLTSCAFLESFVIPPTNPQRVRWMETQLLRNRATTNVSLIDADLDVSELIAEHLFEKFSTVVLCSATLTTNKSFEFMRQRMGIPVETFDAKTVKENMYEAPFDYEKQALLAVPSDMPLPSDPRFVAEAAERIWDAIVASRGQALILFTSYQMLKQCYGLIQQRCAERRFPLFKQGDENRHTLLDKLRTTPFSVLMATYSFWEGVDIVGDALRCVVIVKLPFKVPTEPLIQARSEAMIADGIDPFMEYSVPMAIVKFKQGFGRLIRNKRDRGCIVCLDSRLITKRYGNLFLASLPSCQRVFDTSDVVKKRMEDFYRQTQHLVVK